MKLLIKNSYFPDFQKFKFFKKNIIVEKNIIRDLTSCEVSVSNSNFDKIIDAEGLIVSPGFIDVHSHSDLACINDKKFSPKVLQGISSEIVGNCGLSVVPIKPDSKKEWYSLYGNIWGNNEVEWKWTNAASYLNHCKKKSISNIETLIGYSALRFYLTKLSSEKYSKDMLNKMESLIASELESGAAGISIGIGYPPNIFADRSEYELIAKLVKKYDKILAVHMRDEGAKVIESIKEIMEYTEKYNCKIQLSHLKAYGKKNWQKTGQILKLIDIYNKRRDITFDSYPYTAGSTTLTSLLPPTLLNKPKQILLKEILLKKTQDYIENCIKEGLPEWENYAGSLEYNDIYPTGLSSKKYNKFEGLSLFDIAEKTKQNIIKTICSIISEENGTASMIMKSMNESNVIEIFKHPKHMVGSDGLFGTKPHPRTYGAFPRVINRFCKELKVMDLLTALYQMTKFPAERFNIKSRGQIKKNFAADLTIFDYEKIKDVADFANPERFPEGIKHIIINGKIIN
ncbi:MAG TPA: amidohydrolase family protein [bacterium]|nr:amidohydrolase family protein [bacterium]HPN30519.1 amidohydrolase family protein [bacterium]